MNEPRPTSSQPGVSHSQGQPALRPAAVQPARVPGTVPQAQTPHAPPGLQSQSHPRVGPQPVAAAHRPSADGGVISLEDDEPIALEDAPSAPIIPAGARLASTGTVAGATALPATASGLPGPSKIKFASGGDKHTYLKFRRQTHVSGTGACRVRSFHGRLSDDGLAFMDDKINEWLDSHPEVEVKLVNCFCGPLEGKVTGEQGLIVTLWY
jgi:hypothetical protein